MKSHTISKLYRKYFRRY